MKRLLVIAALALVAAGGVYLQTSRANNDKITKLQQDVRGGVDRLEGPAEVRRFLEWLHSRLQE